jgi:hypothetical protein
MLPIYTAKPNACAGLHNGNNKSTTTNPGFLVPHYFFSVCALHITKTQVLLLQRFRNNFRGQAVTIYYYRKVADLSCHAI